MDFQSIVNNFNTTPFLFIGSGLSRRYYNLPDWTGLLKIFVTRLSNDEFAFEKYMNLTDSMAGGDQLAAVAGLIKKEYDARWFDDPSFRIVNDEFRHFIQKGHSPFKVELAQYIKENSKIDSNFTEEIESFKKLSERSISGFLTTNYDLFLESMTGYSSFIGQEELIFSSMNGWAEIYKIHGCINNPNSIVITDDDYRFFREHCPYLAAKLMTIFMENPIIFIGYSINDSNIRLILNEIGKCLSSDNLKKLQNRFIYIQREKGQQELQLFEHSVNIGEHLIHMTGVKTDNFNAIYKALTEKKAALPMRMLRIFKESFYAYATSNTPNKYLRIGHIDDKNIKDDNLIIGIGRPSDFSINGLYGITREQWFYNIILNNLPFSPDELLGAYQVIKSRGAIPLNKLLASSVNKYPQCMNDRYTSIDKIVSKTVRLNRNKRRIPDKSISGILKNRNQNDQQQREISLYDMIHLKETQIDINELETFLQKTLNDKEFIDGLTATYKTSLFQLISIYDYIKYSKLVTKNNV